jgi:predicted transcriptional regulator
MQIREYLIETKWTQQEFAQRCGICEKSLWSIIHGINPTLATAEKIVNASNQMITFVDLCANIKKTKKCNSPKRKPSVPKAERWKRK